MFFFESFSNPLKSTFGAHLVLNLCQNNSKIEPVWVLGSIKKTILCKKTENSNPLIIYNTLSMSTPPKTPPLWLLKSNKIKEKKDPENEPQKNTKN